MELDCVGRDAADIDLIVTCCYQVAGAMACLEAIQMIRDEGKIFPTTLVHIAYWIRCAWTLDFQHVRCSRNTVADAMAKLADVHSFEVVWFTTAPINIVELLQTDMSGLVPD
ncbi:hypothetical protein V6N13_014200 [Hibiscus sabdariffa]|uniref:RNase H type-1 domain-containing protein n=1 Tax=Hibiscus sabdariffa TaxID=183260 RepID=A0ABR2RUJ7_9ROSI